MVTLLCTASASRGKNERFAACAARTQPIIVNATADMLKEHFLPVARKLREQALNMRKEEEEFHAETRRLQHRKESGDVESEIQEVRVLITTTTTATTKADRP